MSLSSVAAESHTVATEIELPGSTEDKNTCTEDINGVIIATWKRGMNGSLEAEHVPGRLSSGQSSGNALLLRCALAHACCCITYSRGLAPHSGCQGACIITTLWALCTVMSVTSLMEQTAPHVFRLMHQGCPRTSQTVHALSGAVRSAGESVIQGLGSHVVMRFTRMHVFRGGKPVGWGEARMLQREMVHLFGCATGKADILRALNHEKLPISKVRVLMIHVGRKSICMQPFMTRHVSSMWAPGPALILHMSSGARTKWVLLGW